MNHSGLYALVALDGAPIAPEDAIALGFPPETSPILARAVDGAMPGAINVALSPDRVTLFLGYFDEPEELCEMLGLPHASDPIALARAGFERCGADLPAAAIGEWSLLDWRADHGLTVMSSSARRDPVFFSRRGKLVAISPSLHSLGKLGWIDRSIDEAGMMVSIGHYHMRRAMPDRTLLRDVRRLPPGGSMRWDALGEHAAQSCKPSPAQAFGGSIHDAADQTANLLRRMFRQRLSRIENAGCLLSGGLDSSLVAWLLADQRDPGQPVTGFCSAAAPNSGFADEFGQASTVAEHLHLPLEAVVPEQYLSPYRPADARLEKGAGIILDPRHYLYDALAEAAAARTVSALFDGCYGEGTVTAHLPLATVRYRLREMARRIAGRPNLSAPFPGVSIARVAPHRFPNFSRELQKIASSRPDDDFRAVDPRGPWVFPPGGERRAAPPTELMPGRVRVEFPFRDVRLLQLFSGFPAAFMTHGALDRAPVRLILKDRVPETIRLQGKGLPFAPDHNLRLKLHAADAAARIPEFRRAGIDDWLDLDWLGEALGGMSAHGPQSLDSALEVQFTAIAAEFMLWWCNPAA